MPGRPRASETHARTRELLRLIAGGKTLAEASTQARVKPDRVLRLLDQDEFFTVYQQLRHALDSAA